MTALTVTYMPIEQLIPYARNSRTHSDAQIAQIAASIREFQWTNPVLVDGDGGIIAGHGRVLAARQLGMQAVPCIRLGHLTPTQKRALIIADNKLALNAGWDDDTLKLELEELQSDGFDIGITGFSGDELADLLADRTVGLTDPDDAPEPPVNPVTVPGDLWLLGRHRIVCGDGTDLETVARLTAGTVPDLANCDPPYGIKVVKGGTIGGAKPFGRVHGRSKNAIIEPNTYAPIIGDETTDTAVASHAMLSALKVPVIVLWGGNYFAEKMPPSRCWLVWDKENTGTFADAELAWTNQDRVVKLFRHQWSGLIKASERGERRVHPTQKPVALADWVTETMAPKAKTIIDLFLGSAPTLISAERSGQALFGVEMSPAYVDVAVKRWQEFTGQTATLEATGQTFAEVCEQRYAATGAALNSAGSYDDAVAGARKMIEAAE